MRIWNFSNFEFIPKTAAFAMGVSTFGALVVATLHRDVSIYLPFISEAGSEPPASLIFNTFMHITAIFCFLTAILGYVMIEERMKEKKIYFNRLNKAVLVCGSTVALGLSLVAIFPFTRNWMTHSIAALLTFVSAGIVSYLYAWMSYKFCPEYCSLFICRCRLVLAVSGTISVLIHLIFGKIGFYIYQPANGYHETWLKTPEDEGFIFLFVASLAEWISHIFMIAYLLTLSSEFKNFSIDVYMKCTYNPSESPNDVPNGNVTVKDEKND